MEQELWGSSYSIFNFICMFCRSLFIFLSFFFWPLRCLSFFDLRILITALVSSNSPWIKLMGQSRMENPETQRYLTSLTVLLFYTNLYYLFTDSFAITCNVFGEVYHVHAKFETSIRKVSYLKLKKKIMTFTRCYNE